MRTTKLIWTVQLAHDGQIICHLQLQEMSA